MLEGMTEKISEHMCCQRGPSLMNASDEEEYLCLREFQLNRCYFIKEHPFPNEMLFKVGIIADMFDGYGAKTPHTKRVYKSIKDFVTAYPYGEQTFYDYSRNARKKTPKTSVCFFFFFFDVLCNA